MKKAQRIINAYAETLQRLDGHDAPLCLIQGYWLCRAMMIEVDKLTSGQVNELSEKNGNNSSTEKWEAMLRRAMVPTMNRFEADSPYANGNWGAIVNRFRMACAIAIGDSAMYQAAIEYYLHAYDNGSLPRYVSETGQCQETGRDQAHAQLGLEAMADICEMAWEQGDDLWGALDNRLMKGFEYTAKYNLGYDVPFETWTDCIALYNHRWWYWGGSEDIEVSHCILWPDVAHPVNIGSHGDDRNPDGETLRHVRIHDCDIIGDDAAGLGLLAINCGDNNHIRDIRFERIRAEGLRRCRPFDLRIFQSEKYNRAPGCCIDSIAFVDFTISPDVPDSFVLPSRVEGMPEHPVGRYTLERVSHTAVTATNL